MTRMPKQHEGKCSDCTFSLISMNSSNYYSKKTTASFCQSISRKNENQYISKHQNKPIEVNCYNGPIYNKDNNYASSGFILPDEKLYYHQSIDRIIQEHEIYVNNLQRENLQLFVAKPKSKIKYCSVCKINYDDYLPHIQSCEHKKKCKSAKFNKYILQIEDKFRNENLQKLCLKRKSSKNQQNTIISISEDSIQQRSLEVQDNVKNHQRPRKIQKRDPVVDNPIEIVQAINHFQYPTLIPSYNFPQFGHYIPPFNFPNFGFPSYNYTNQWLNPYNHYTNLYQNIYHPFQNQLQPIQQQPIFRINSKQK